jgi:hypothetical protein
LRGFCGLHDVRDVKTGSIQQVPYETKHTLFCANGQSGGVSRQDRSLKIRPTFSQFGLARVCRRLDGIEDS